MSLTSVSIWSAVLAYMKAATSVTSLLSASSAIKEAQWQGTVFVYPAVRVSLDLYPDITGRCPDRAELFIDCFSEEKSSMQAQILADAVYILFHKVPFNQGALKFSNVTVTKISRPVRTVEAWQSMVTVSVLVS